MARSSRDPNSLKGMLIQDLKDWPRIFFGELLMFFIIPSALLCLIALPGFIGWKLGDVTGLVAGLLIGLILVISLVAIVIVASLRKRRK